MDMEKIERAVRDILEAVGEDPDREGLQETPARVARMYGEIFSGLGADPKQHLKIFTEGGLSLIHLSEPTRLRISPSIRCVSTICCPLSAGRILPISQKTGELSGFPNLPGLWTVLPGVPRYRSV